MKSCTSCNCASTCSSPCDRLQAAIRPRWSTSLHELAIGGLVEIIPSSQAHAPENSEFPFFEKLRPIESKILKFYYADGMKYAEIGKKLRKKKSFVKSTISRARGKFGALISIGDGEGNGK